MQENRPNCNSMQCLGLSISDNLNKAENLHIRRLTFEMDHNIIDLTLYIKLKAKAFRIIRIIKKCMHIFYTCVGSYTKVRTIAPL